MGSFLALGSSLTSSELYYDSSLVRCQPARTLAGDSAGSQGINECQRRSMGDLVPQPVAASVFPDCVARLIPASLSLATKQGVRAMSTHILTLAAAASSLTDSGQSGLRLVDGLVAYVL
jgi:hypothetical protein